MLGSGGHPGAARSLHPVGRGAGGALPDFRGTSRPPCPVRRRESIQGIPSPHRRPDGSGYSAGPGSDCRGRKRAQGSDAERGEAVASAGGAGGRVPRAGKGIAELTRILLDPSQRRCPCATGDLWIPRSAGWPACSPPRCPHPHEAAILLLENDPSFRDFSPALSATRCAKAGKASWRGSGPSFAGKAPHELERARRTAGWTRCRPLFPPPPLPPRPRLLGNLCADVPPSRVRAAHSRILPWRGLPHGGRSGGRALAVPHHDASGPGGHGCEHASSRRTVGRTFSSGPHGLLTLGLFNSLTTVLPILSVFFLVFGLLEDIGYLPNLAILTRRVAEKIGITGNAIIPLVLGFGCKTMATMTARNLQSRKEKIIVIALIAFAIPCSAQMGLSIAILGQHGLALFCRCLRIPRLAEVGVGAGPQQGRCPLKRRASSSRSFPPSGCRASPRLPGRPGTGCSGSCGRPSPSS